MFCQAPLNSSIQTPPLASQLNPSAQGLQIFQYDLVQNKSLGVAKLLLSALAKAGAAGISNVPGLSELRTRYIQEALAFSRLPQIIKLQNAPTDEGPWGFLGYAQGGDQFLYEGTWYVDKSKNSFYATIPDRSENRWPQQTSLKSAFLDLGEKVSEVGQAALHLIGLVGPGTQIPTLEGVSQVGRMLYYSECDPKDPNKFWCSEHVGHSLGGMLIKPAYFKEGKEVEEPPEAGLFVKVDGQYRKFQVKEDTLLLQVGEAAQLILNDTVRATWHRVDKPSDTKSLERFNFAFFFKPPMDTRIHSNSELTNDSRFVDTGSGCVYEDWHKASLARYLNKQN
ncbi:MAG: hypothetical protein S4CHLAM6_08370 [Chlamydiae bacterium]|nr:hypothetical protein [Chlamydiota bacterium]